MGRVRFTAAKVQGFECPADKAQAFLWDATVQGLALRVTPGGGRSYVFQHRFQGKTLRTTIGTPNAWTIGQAQEKARELRRQIDEGRDPREVKAEASAADTARRQADAAKAITVGDVWPVYLAEGKPRGKTAWKPRYRADLEKAAAPGGELKLRGQGRTKPGHLAPLMPLALADIDADVIREWYGKEKKRAPVQAGRAVAMFSGFLAWCATRKEYRGNVQREAARSVELADLLPAKRRRTDALEADQLAPWFAGTQKLRSAAARAYLQGLVLTGARREELAGLRWGDLDLQWRKLTIADKVGDTRTIPLTPYLGMLLTSLPRTKLADGTPNPYVFASTIGAKSGKPRSASGRITEPRAPHADVLADAGIPHVSIHGLRRTFALMGEAAGAPAGAIAQVMGHRPSAVAEGYKPRSIDALRPYLALVERFILDKAGIAFEASAPAAGGLRVVAALA
jgi:integrase